MKFGKSMIFITSLLIILLLNTSVSASRPNFASHCSLQTNSSTESIGFSNGGFYFESTNIGELTFLLDDYGNTIVAAQTVEPQFSLENGYDTSYNGNQDLIIASFAPNGSLLWNTFLGGIYSDHMPDIALDGENIIVVGQTTSPAFPITYPQDTNMGGSDIFITSFNLDGSLNWSRLLGGSDDEEKPQIRTDTSGNLLVAGITFSEDFPVQDSYQSEYSGVQDSFVASFSSQGVYNWGTYLGGSDREYSLDLEIGINDTLHIFGTTYSDDFPLLNSTKESRDDYLDLFLSTFSSDGDLLSSSYLGGNGSDESRDMSIDSQGNIYLTGQTTSSDFASSNSYQETFETHGDAYVLSLTQDSQIRWSTYLGGSGIDKGYELAIDSKDNVYLFGQTSSSDLPVYEAAQPLPGKSENNKDAFLASFSEQGDARWITYVGERYEEYWTDPYAEKIKIDTSDNIYITGTTTSYGFPTLNPIHFPFDGASMGGGSDMYLSSYTEDGKLRWSTFFGGTGSEYYGQIAMDNQDLIIMGTTYSPGFLSQLQDDEQRYTGNNHIFHARFSPDSDADGMPDNYEIQHGLDPNINDAEGDLDGDGLPNFYEYKHGLKVDENDAYEDSDGDLMPNIWEYQHGLDPQWDDSGDDPDNDGRSNLEEYRRGSDPNAYTRTMANFYSYVITITIVVVLTLRRIIKRRMHKRQLEAHRQRLIEETSI